LKRAPEFARTGFQICQALLLVELEQRGDEFVHVAGDNLIEVEVLLAASFSAEAVIGAAILGKVVGSDALRAIAGAHHRLAR
jgi:hypothetical protein